MKFKKGDIVEVIFDNDFTTILAPDVLYEFIGYTENVLLRRKDIPLKKHQKEKYVCIAPLLMKEPRIGTIVRSDQIKLTQKGA